MARSARRTSLPKPSASCAACGGSGEVVKASSIKPGSTYRCSCPLCLPRLAPPIMRAR